MRRSKSNCGSRKSYFSLWKIKNYKFRKSSKNLRSYWKTGNIRKNNSRTPFPNSKKLSSSTKIWSKTSPKRIYSWVTSSKNLYQQLTNSPPKTCNFINKTNWPNTLYNNKPLNSPINSKKSHFNSKNPTSPTKDWDINSKSSPLDSQPKNKPNSHNSAKTDNKSHNLKDYSTKSNLN